MRLLLLLLLPSLAQAEARITIERATVPWNELERLLRKEGATPPPRNAPRAYSVPSLEVAGEIDGGHAQLDLTVEVEVLGDRWTVAPLLPASLAVATASVEAPAGRRGLLVRDPGGVSLAADGAGRYRVHLEAEGALERGRLLIAPGGLAGGRARLTIHGADGVGGRTSWRTRSGSDGTLIAEAALGPFGVDLSLASAPASVGEAGATIEDLSAVTVLSLGGSGVTRLQFQASADESAPLELALPKGARLWRVYVGGSAVAAATVLRGENLRLALKKPARVELAFTFEAPPMGIRGRYHVELPKLPVPVRGAHWDVWLPSGLAYGAPQAAMSAAPCSTPSPAVRPRTPITPVGTCVGFERPVLEPGRTYVEGKYDQPL
jgi:hypothetical protein